MINVGALCFLTGSGCYWAAPFLDFWELTHNHGNLLEPPPDAQKKIKKAFCEPANVAHCPPLVLAREVVLAHAEGRALRVARQEGEQTEDAAEHGCGGEAKRKSESRSRAISMHLDGRS